MRGDDSAKAANAKAANAKELRIFLPVAAVVIGGLFFFYLGYGGQVADYLSAAWTDFRDGTRTYGRVAVMLGLLLGITFGAMGSWLVGKRMIQAAVKQTREEAEQQVLAVREEAALEARHVMAAARRIEEAAHEGAQDEVLAALDQVAKREQEAAVQIEKAEFRLQRSVDTNIGRQKTIQKLRKRVDVLEKENQELKKRISELEGEE